jgi:Zn-dependent peptidase ImmA (M78 family)
MKKITLEIAELLAEKLRCDELNFSKNEPVSIKTVLRKLNILTIFRPLSENVWGLSLITPDKKHKFILVNSNISIGAQNYTVAHELFHLYFDENPKPHLCGQEHNEPTERSANIFASVFMLPKEGILKNISHEEIINKEVKIDTCLRLEQLYEVSHKTFILRLKELNIISSSCFEKLQNLSIKKEASLRGYDDSLYSRGNENLIIGDFGSKARQLYEMEKISEGHYLELLNLINYGKS